MKSKSIGSFRFSFILIKMWLIKSIKCYNKHPLYSVFFTYSFAQKGFIELQKNDNS